MAEGTKKKENNARSVYADIIDLPHPVSVKHPQMSLHDRAAQFASYKALSGYEDMIGEEARLTDRRIEPEEADLDILNRKLTLIGDRIAEGESPVVTFTVFVPDEKKAGGAYVTRTVRVKHIDAAQQEVVLCPERIHVVSERVPIGDILDIRGESVSAADAD